MKHRSSPALRRVTYALGLLLLLMAIGRSQQAYAQLTVSYQSDLSALAASITGPGVTIINPEINCGDSAFGEFSYAGSQLGLEEGVLLTTGRLNDAVGPNGFPGGYRYDSGTGEEPILETVTGRSTFNRCRFEFDIIPTGDSLRFNFVFASEEYNEWVGSQYNDVFGFFISGPGIAGDPGIGADKNIALIPGTSQAVAINNVNNGQNSAFYRDNTGGSEIQYDGFTQGLYAESRVNACQTYHLKLIVADASDEWWDSGVFIERIRSNQVTMTSHTLSGAPEMVEGCNPGWVTFTRSGSTANALNLSYFLRGTATNGTDYAAIGNVNPNVPKSVTIPAGAASVNVNVNPTADGANEGSEFLHFILGNPFCPAQDLDTLFFEIADTLIATLAPLNPIICRGDSVQLLVTGGANYTWTPASTLSNASIANPWAKPTANTTYQVVVTDGTCQRTMRRIVRVSDIQLSSVITPPLCQGSLNGSINITATGGIAPYGFSWTSSTGGSWNTEDLTGIGAGVYTVTVTDGNGCVRERSFTVTEPALLTSTLSPSIQPFGENIACHGASTGSIGLTIQGGTVPYTVSWTGPNGFTSSAADIANLAAGPYTVTVTDINGCQTANAFTLAQPDPLITSITGTTPVLCFGDGAGSATVGVTGGRPPYNYSWNNPGNSTTSTASGLAAGNYTVTVTDSYGCASQVSATVSGPTAALLASTNAQTNVGCTGGATGSATVSAIGGTSPYSYAWNTTPVQNGPSATALSAGTWTSTVTDANGCTYVHVVTITEPALALSSSVSELINVSCAGGNNGRTTVAVAGGTAPYTFTWNTTPAQTTATAQNLGAGTFTCTIVDARGCSVQQVVTITAPATLSASITGSTAVSCFGGNNGSATAAVSGGTAPYAVSWNTTPVQNTLAATNLSAGTWTCTVVDANGCITQVQAVITQPAAALSTSVISTTSVACHGGSTGSATVAAAGGTAPYTFTWNTTPAQVGATASGLPAGNWICTVTDQNGCTAQREVIISQPAQPLSATVAGTTSVNCFSGSNGTASVNAAGGTAPYTFSWNTTPVQTTASATGLAAGTYTCTITDARGCQTTVNAVITQPAQALSASIASSTAVSCNGGNNGAATATALGGTAPYAYSWNTIPAQNTANATGLTAGSWTCTVTDSRGCVTTTNITITQPTAALTTTTSIVPAACLGAANGAIDASIAGGTSPYTYVWTGPGAFSATSQDITNVSAGIYQLVVTDANGCTHTSSWNVGQPGLFTVSTTQASYIGGANVSCPTSADGSIDLTVSGATPPYTYAWSGPSGYTNTTQDISGLQAGSYTVIITDDNGCSTTTTVLLSAPSPISIGTSTSDFNGFGVACAGGNNGSITTTISGGVAPLSHVWTGPGAFSANTPNISGRIAGAYALVITDANGCTANANVSLTEPTAITVTATQQQAVQCHAGSDGSAFASASGGVAPYGFNWNSTPAQAGQLLSGVAAGSWTVTVTDANGCSAQQSTTITQPAQPVAASITATTNATCLGAANGSLTASANGGTAPYTYSWNTVPVQTGTTAIGLSAGTYSCTITDVNGCSTTINGTVGEPAAAVSIAQTANTPVSCHGGSNGSATVIASGGTGPYSYSWNTSPTTAGPVASGLAAGTYTVTATDAQGCTAQLAITITAPNAPLSAGIVGQLDQTCFASATGQATVSATGGTAPYTYAWSTTPVQTSTTAVGLANGTYTVTVRDARLCETSTTVTIGGPAAPLAASITSITPVLCFGGDTGGAVGAASGGTPPYQYLWSTVPNATTPSISGQIAGTYVFNVTDANGCTTATTATITQPASGIAGFVESIGMVSCNGGQDGNAVIGITGGSGNYNVVWNTNPVQTGTSISGLGAGTYLAQITDQNGCTEPKFLPVTITQPAAPLTATLVPIVYTGGFNTSCVNATDGGINATIVGGTLPYTITWSTPGGTPLFTEDIFNIAPGSYGLSVTDVNGCATSASVLLTAPVAITATAQIVPAACQGAANGAITLTAQGGVGPYAYSWSGPNGFTSTARDISGLASGVYSVTVTDANGCTNVFLFDVAQPGLFAASATVSTFPGGAGVSCSNATNGSIAVDLSGGTPGYTYAWSGPNGFTANSEDLTGLAAGVYQLIYTDANGCSGSLTATITAPAPIGLAITAATFGTFNVACNGGSNGSATLTITGGVAPYTIAWNGPNGSTFNTAAINGLAAGSYTVLVTDVNGCTATASIVLTEPPVLTTSASIVPQPNGGAISCAGATDGAIDLSVNGGTAPYTVLWSGPNGYTSTALDPTGLAPGTYTALVTDARGCTASASIILTAPTPIDLQATLSSYIGGQAISCFDANDGSIDLQVNGGAGGYLYTWTGSGAFASTSQDVSGLGAGTYTVSVIDINGCQAQSSFTLQAPTPMNAGAAVINALCQGNADGSIDLTITGGTAPYTQTWSSGFGVFTSTQEDLNNLFAAVYTVAIQDANGCTFQRSFNVDEPEQFLIDGRIEQYPGGSNVSCAGASDGAIEVDVTGGTAPYTLTWLTPSGTLANITQLNGIPAGSYELIIIDQNGCSGLAQYELVEPTPVAIGLLPSQYPGGANTTCDQATSGSIDAIVDGGISPYTYAWTGPNAETYTTEDITGLGAGAYTLLVTDLTGCQSSATITLTQPAPLTTTIDVGAASGGGSLACNGTTDGFIDLTVGGGTAPYQYLWNGPNSFGSTAQDIDQLSAGTYTVSIVDLNGCTTTATATIQEPSPVNVTLAVGEFGNGLQLPCFGSSEGSVSATATGGTPTYTYAWSGPNGFTASTAAITNVPAGNYTLVVTDLNGCATTVQTTLQQPQPLAIDALISDAGSGYQVSCLGNDGAIDLTISGGTAPYITEWSSTNGSAFLTADLNGIGAGTYTLQLTDANGCTATVERTLTAPAPIVTSATASAVICNGAADGTIDLAVNGGVGNYTYSWTGPDGFTASTQDLNNLVGGTYTVVIGDDANCTASTSATIVISGAMDADVYRSTYGGVNIPCVGDSSGVLEVNVSGGTAPVTIAWTGPNGFTSDLFDLSGLVAGSYAFTLTDANGCTMDSTLTLVEPDAALDAQITAQVQASGTNISCFGGNDGSLSATVSGGTGPYTYAWRGPNDELFDSATINGLLAGDFELVVTDANACQTTLNITLTQPDTALAVTASLSDFGGPNVSCNGSSDGSIGIAVNGGSPTYSIAWNGPNGFTSTQDTLSDLIAGNYSVTITDINGCSVTLDQELIAPAPVSTTALLSSFVGGTAISCAGASDGSITLSTAGGTGTIAVNWSGPNGYAANGPSINGLSAGTYCATLTDGNGCSSDTCFVITAPAALELLPNTVSASCGADNGTASVSVSGGAAPYTYTWSNGATAASTSGLAPGNYSVQVIDANACNTEIAITVTGTPALDAALDANAPLCQGAQNGTVSVAIANGQAPYSYVWSTGGNTAVLNDLPAGTYAVTVTDANGCSWSGNTVLTEPTAVEVGSSVSSYDGGYQVSGFGAGDGSIELTTTGGVVPYSYAWSNGANSASISGLSAGTYSVTVTDANGCPVFLEFELEAPDDLRQPTGFTPNNDGSNDFYVVRGLDAYPENRIVIFNRWGNVVFERLNYTNDWAGENMTGELLPNGTYFVILTIPALDRTLQNYVDLRR